MTACWCHSLHFSRYFSLDQGYTAAWSRLECIWEIESSGWGWGICEDFTFWIVFEVWQDGVHEPNRADAEKRCHTLWRMRGHGFTMIYMCMVVECGHGFMLPYHIHFSIKTSLYQPHLFRAWLCQTYLDPTNLCQALALSNLTLQSITVTNVKIPFLKFSLPTFSLYQINVYQVCFSNLLSIKLLFFRCSCYQSDLSQT